MTITHHRIKTHGRWQVQQPFPGIYVWRDQYGVFFLVDNTGTRRTKRPDADPGASRWSSRSTATSLKSSSTGTSCLRVQAIRQGDGVGLGEDTADPQSVRW